MTGKQLMVGVIAVAIVALGLAAYFILWGGQSSDSDLPDLPKYKITLSPSDHTLGSPNAPIQFVEYAAPTCPICARWDMTVFPGFKSAYVDSGKVYYVFRVFPLQQADLAVEAMARCLPKDRYFPFIDMMYHNQSKWDPDGFQIPDVHAAILAMGVGFGMDKPHADACMSNEAVLKNASDIGNYAGTNYNINSTPSFIIDGEFHQQEVMTPDALKEFLDAELKRKAS